MRFKYMIPVAGMLLLLAAGCKKDDIAAPIDRTTAPRSIGEFIQNNYDLSLLQAAVTRAGMSDSLNLPGKQTFFAPDNAAFNAMGIVSPADFDKMDADSLRRMLNYHIIPDRYFISGFPFQLDNKYTTLAGDPLYVSVSGGEYGQGSETRTVCVNGAYVSGGTKRNIALANGVVHIIRKPLKFHRGAVQDFIARDTSLALFAVVMKRFGLWDSLKLKDPLTVFAPVNAAFLKYGLSADSIGRMSPAAYQDLAFGIYPLMLQARHIFSTDGWMIAQQAVYGRNGILIGNYSLAPNYSYNSYTNEETSGLNIFWFELQDWVSNNAGPGSINYKDESVINADFLTLNGIVHKMDDLIFYPEAMKK